ncbi:unnamed protein product [Meloidogyne enterolobii]|uniref:Uncharacterized protein n=1 Tax=Meloidogyne enterolobii TaxID=390850 RepID=A0ACB0Z4Z0_MELEN
MHGHEIPSTTSTTEITTKTTTATMTTTKNQMETTTREGYSSTTSPPSDSKTFIIVIVVVIVVIFIATFIVLLLCLSLCCKKSEKVQTVKMATARSTDSYMIADRGKPKIEASPTYEDIQTQVTYATDLQVKKYVSSTNIGEGTTVVGKQTVNDTMDDKRMSTKVEERSKGESTFE